MGAGKSTVGKHLSRNLGLQFIDLDRYIEERNGCTVAEFFDLHGEAAFRQEELESLSSVLDNYTGKDLVLSLGGGTLTNPECGKLVKQYTLCFYLHCTPEEIARRVSKNETKRPLLAKRQIPDLTAHIRNLMSEREAVYRQYADYTVQSGNGDIAQVLNTILHILQNI